MKSGRMPWAALAAIVVIALGWFVMRPDAPPEPPRGGGTAIIEQPSGRVIGESGSDDAVSVTVPGRPDAPQAGAGGAPSADTEPDAKVARAPMGDGVTPPADAPADPPSAPVVVADDPEQAAGETPAGEGTVEEATPPPADAVTPPASDGRDDASGSEARDVGASARPVETVAAGDAEKPGIGTGASATDEDKDATGASATAANQDAATDGKAADAAGDEQRQAAVGDPQTGDAATGPAAADGMPLAPSGTDGKAADGSTGDGNAAEAARVAAVPPATDGTRPTETGGGPLRPADGAGTGPEPDDPDTPRLDLVRVEPDGQAVLAGHASPDTPVEILIDGKVLETVRTDASGNFVAILQMPATGEAQKLQLRVPDPEVASAPAVAGDDEPVLRAPDAELDGPDVRDSAGVEGGAAADATVARAAPAGDVAAPTAPEAADPPAAPERAPDSDPAGAPVAAAPAGAEPAEPTPPTPGELAAVTAPAAPDDVRTGGTDRPVAGARTGPATAGGSDEPTPSDRGPAVPDRVADRGFLTSPPVIILPGSTPDDAPTVLSTTREDLKIVQPSVTDINSVVLDRISYGDTGDVLLQGRGRAGKAVRIYGNGLIVGTTRVASDGTWTMSVDQALGQEIKLLRMDEIDQDGRVVTRIEAPFTYSRFEPKLVRQREVVIQKGDMLWRIAEQYYGEGMRYSVIYGANSKLIRDPDLIYPGQVFTVPELIDADN